LSAGDERERGAGIGERERDVTGRHILERLWTLLVGHRRQRNAEVDRDVFTGEMRRTANR
jgi:hypothetical protein